MIYVISKTGKKDVIICILIFMSTCLLLSQKMNLYTSIEITYNHWIEKQYFNEGLAMFCGGSPYGTKYIKQIKEYPGIQTGILGEYNFIKFISLQIHPKLGYYFKTMYYNNDIWCSDPFYLKGKFTYHNVSFSTPVFLSFYVNSNRKYYLSTGGYSELCIIQANTGLLDRSMCELEGIPPNVTANCIEDKIKLDESMREIFDYGLYFGFGYKIPLFSKIGYINFSYMHSLKRDHGVYYTLNEKYINSHFSLGINYLIIVK